MISSRSPCSGYNWSQSIHFCVACLFLTLKESIWFYNIQQSLRYIPQARSEIKEARFIQRINNEDMFFLFLTVYLCTSASAVEISHCWLCIKGKWWSSVHGELSQGNTESKNIRRLKDLSVIFRLWQSA